MSNQQIEIGDLIFLSQGTWLKSEDGLRWVKQLEKPCLGVTVQKIYQSQFLLHYKVCVGDEFFLLNEEETVKYVREGQSVQQAQ